MTQVFKDVKDNMKRLSEAGVYGVVVEGMKFAKKRGKLIKVGGRFCISKRSITKRFYPIKRRGTQIWIEILLWRKQIENFRRCNVLLWNR